MSPTQPPRVRFAPSPTGHLHIGGARTALFNWLWARRHGGSFVLRIEDTDQARSTEESMRGIIEALSWLGLDWDEGPGKGGPYGPYVQTERLALYKQYADRMVEEGTAYRCYATKEELEALRAQLPEKQRDRFVYPRIWRDKTPGDWLEGKPYVYRFKTPQGGATVFHDEVYGEVKTPNNQIQDFILLRSDGIPLYNFGAVVDDITMSINMVGRGQDHIVNTAPQCLIYDALRVPRPTFAHLPMILGPDGKKLSKRDGEKFGIPVSVQAFREKGYSPEAVLNYLVRFGWSHGDQEVFTRKELVDLFDWKGVGKADGRFDIKKCVAISHRLIKDDAYTPLATYLSQLGPYLEARGVKVDDQARLEAAVAMVRERARTFVEAAEMLDYFFVETYARDDKAVAKFLNRDAAPHLRAIGPLLASCDTWKGPLLEEKVAAYLAEKGLQIKDVAQSLRVAVAGRAATPGLFEVLEVLGRERTLSRIDAAAALAEAQAPAS